MADTSDLRVDKLFSVEGYVCVITGGATGIGLMAAQGLAANGARVYITGRREDALKNASNWHDPQGKGKILPLTPCDVREKDDLERAVREVSDQESHVDLLVAAAGIQGSKAAPDETSAEDLKQKLWQNESRELWNGAYNTNVTAVFFTTVAFLPLLEAGIQRRGHLAASVIVISSISGVMRHAQGHFSYNAAKGGTVQLAKLMSAEFQKLHIRVNSIAPGYFPSEMTAKESGQDNKSALPDSKIQATGHVPAERPGTDEEMAQSILFLAKNRYVNGETLTVDGGVLNVVGG